MTTDPLTIVAWPGPAAGWRNPYIRLLYDAVRRLDPSIRIEEFSISVVLRVRARQVVWHMHWPESVTTVRNGLRAFGNACLIQMLTQLARLRGWRLVWTIHNLDTHERRHTWTERWLMRKLVRRVDGAISLSRAGVAAAYERYPELSERVVAVIPHGNYIDAYPNTVTPAQARAWLSLGEAAGPTILMLGRICRYKNVLHLIHAFSSLEDASARLIIAGAPESVQFARCVRNAARRDARVRVDLHHVADAEVQNYMNAADLVVLPYSDVLHSGSVILAVSFGVPVLVPRLASLPELQDLIGADAVHLYDGSLQASDIVAALAAVRAAGTERAKLVARTRVRLDWDDIARRTLAHFAQACSESA